ncbi:MAG: hypothetical protein EOP09_20790, partial [Proteobacteria bacterium]
MKPLIYLVIPWIGVGGMEKRMVEVWLHHAPNHDRLRLALPAGTLEALRLRPDIGDRLLEYSDRLEIIHP